MKANKIDITVVNTLKHLCLQNKPNTFGSQTSVCWHLVLIKIAYTIW